MATSDRYCPELLSTGDATQQPSFLIGLADPAKEACFPRSEPRESGYLID